MGLQLKAGLKLRSAVDACEVMVVKAPAEPVDLRCGGHPFVPPDAEVTPQSVEAGFDGGALLGKRYADEELGLEVLCTKAGEGSISVGETILPSRAPSRCPPRTDAGTARTLGRNIAMLLGDGAPEGDPDRPDVVVGDPDACRRRPPSEASWRPRSGAAPGRRFLAGTGAEVVGYFGLNADVLPVALFGAAMAGVPFAPINYRAPDEQLRGIIGRVSGGVMIADDDEVERLGACGATHIVTKGEFAAAIGGLRRRG